MQFDPNNKIVKHCAEGMVLEGNGKMEEAAKLFRHASTEASSDLEKFIAAHYIARHQNNVEDKLKWDETALHLALQIDDENMKAHYPSLYLNIAKCHEDIKDFAKANENYQFAELFTNYLFDDGYGNMIKAGIKNGIERMRHQAN